MDEPEITATPEPDWDILLVRYLEGASNENQTKAVESRLERDSEFRRQLVEFSVTRSMLPAVLAQPAIECDDAPPAPPTVAIRRSRSKRRVPSRAINWSAAATIAAIVMLAVGLNLKLFNNPARPERLLVVSRLEQGSGVTATGTDGAARKLRANSSLVAGDRLAVPADGLVELLYPDGTELSVPGPAVLRIDKGAAVGAGVFAKRVYLESGALNGDVSPQPAGFPFVLATPNAQATVLGTVFTLKVDTGTTDLEVLRGKVRLSRQADSAAVDVPAGSFAIADATSPLVVKQQTPAAAAPFNSGDDTRQLLSMSREEVAAYLVAFARSIGRDKRLRRLPAPQILFTTQRNGAGEHAFALKTNGDSARLSSFDIGRPNETYFKHLDYIVKTASDLNVGLRLIALRVVDIQSANGFIDEANGATFGTWFKTRYASSVGTTLLLTDFDGSLPRGALKEPILGTMRFVETATGREQREP